MISQAETAPARAPNRRRRPVQAEVGPDPVDVHVGSRIRERRLTLGMSQTALGNALGLTFQQVQKYERGTNRVSASTLWKAATTLKVPASYFFEGMEDGAIPPAPEDESARSVLVLSRAINRLDPDLRDQVAQLVTAIARNV